MTDRHDRHLDRDQLERFLERLRPPEAAGPPVEHHRHLTACDRCARKLASLRRLDRALATLPTLEPPPHFARAVMARVRLPVPWHARLLADLRRHPLVALGIVATVLSTAGLLGWLLVRWRLAVGGVLDLALERGQALFWSAVVGLARMLWLSPLADLARGAAAGLAPETALATLAGVSLLGGIAAWTMARMLRGGPSPATVSG